MKYLNLTKIIIALIGLWLLIRVIPNIVGTLLYNSEFDSPNIFDDTVFGTTIWYGRITLEYFIVNIIFGLFLIIFKDSIAKFLIKK